MPFGQQNLCTFQSKTPRYKATNCQHSLRKDAIDLSRGAYSAGARSALMRMRKQCIRILAFLVRQKARRKRRHDYPDVVETERSVPYSLRKRRKIVAALKLPRPETEERGVSIQKARRKRTHDIDNLAIIHVSSCNDVLALQEMSLATFRIELGLHSMCMSRLHALYFMLRTPMTLAPRSAFSFFACSVRITVIRVFVPAPPTHRDQSLRVCRRPRTHWYIHTVNWLVRIGTAYIGLLKNYRVHCLSRLRFVRKTLLVHTYYYRR